MNSTGFQKGSRGLACSLILLVVTEAGITSADSFSLLNEDVIKRSLSNKLSLGRRFLLSAAVNKATKQVAPETDLLAGASGTSLTAEDFSNLTNQAYPAHGLSQCYKCDNIMDPHDCTSVTTCPSDQICGITTQSTSTVFSHFYTFGCFDKRICIAMTKRLFAMREALGDNYVGKRQVQLCATCCGNDLCNFGDCAQLTEKMYTLYKQGRLNVTTLEYH